MIVILWRVFRILTREYKKHYIFLNMHSSCERCPSDEISVEALLKLRRDPLVSGIAILILHVVWHRLHQGVGVQEFARPCKNFFLFKRLSWSEANCRLWKQVHSQRWRYIVSNVLALTSWLVSIIVHVERHHLPSCELGYLRENFVNEANACLRNFGVLVLKVNVCQKNRLVRFFKDGEDLGVHGLDGLNAQLVDPNGVRVNVAYLVICPKVSTCKRSAEPQKLLSVHQVCVEKFTVVSFNKQGGPACSVFKPVGLFL